MELGNLTAADLALVLVDFRFAGAFLAAVLSATLFVVFLEAVLLVVICRRYFFTSDVVHVSEPILFPYYSLSKSRYCLLVTFMVTGLPDVTKEIFSETFSIDFDLLAYYLFDA